MANTTNFNWETPDDTDLVKDGAAAIRTLGNSIDTTMVDLKGGASGYILSKASGTDMDFTWIANDQGDITGVTAGTGISGGGTSGTVTITNSMATEITAAGDIIVGTGSGTFDNLPIGTTGQVLTADTTVSPYKVKWAAASSTPTFAGTSLYKSGNQSISNATLTAITFDSEHFDTDAYHSTSTNTSRITIPSGKNGYYRISGTLKWDPNGTGDRACAIYKNGSNVRWVYQMGAGASAVYNFSFAITLNLAVGDYVELYGYQSSGGNLNALGTTTDTSFEVSFIGA